MRLGPGDLFASDYRIIRPLAEGGMGSVFVASQISTGRPRAIKIMRPELMLSDDARRRFAQEARIAARIESEHIVEVHAAGIDDATQNPYIVMELLIGEDLGSHVRRVGPQTPARVARILSQVFHAIAAAHAAGVVHRDLKPENIFLAEPKRANTTLEHVKVLDFGIAKVLGDQQSTGNVGTPLWLAPEQTGVQGVNPSTDVWALALIAYWMLTGSSFWRSAHDPNASVAAFFRELLIDPIPKASSRSTVELPAGFDTFFEKCVTRDRQARFEDARAAWTELERILEARASAPIAFEHTSLAVETREELVLANHPPYVWPAAAETRVRAFLESPRTRCLVVRGPRGCGRTRLLATALRLSDADTLSGRGLRRDTRRFAPLRAALEENDIPALRDALDRADRDAAASDDMQAMSIVESALIAHARSHPLLLSIDDAHFADDATLGLVVRLAATAPKAPLGILVAAPTGIGTAAWDEVLPDLLSSSDALNLGPLDLERARALASGIADFTPEVVDVVLQSSDRLPGAIVRAFFRLWENGALDLVNGRVQLSPSPRLGTALFEEGSAEAACMSDAVAALSALDAPVREEVLTAALERAGHDSKAILTSLHAASIAKIVRHERDGLSVASPIASTRVTTLERVLLSEMAAQPDADAEILAEGWLRLHQNEQARTWLEVAIRRASEGGRFKHAAELTSKLAKIAATPAARSKTLIGRAVHLRRAGLHRLARAQLTLVDPASLEPPDRIHATVVDAQLRSDTGVRNEADAALAQRVDESGSVEDRVDVRLALVRLLDRDRGKTLMNEARSIAAHLDFARRFRIEILSAELAFDSHDLRQAREHVRDAAALAEAEGILWRTIEPAMDLAVLAAEDDPGRGQEELADLEARASEAGLDKLARLAAMNRATLELRVGKNEEAAARAKSVADRAEEAGDASMEGAACGVRSEALQKLGDTKGARDAADRAVTLRERIGDPRTSLALFRLAILTPDREKARGYVKRALAWAEKSPYLDLAERARLWLAMDAGDAKEIEAAIAAAEGPARAPTRVLIEEAKALLARR